MVNTKPTIEFNFESYIASLLEAIGMAKSEPKVQEEVARQLARQLGFRIMNILSIHFTEKDWEGLIASEMKDDLSGQLSKAIQQNPAVKDKLMEELDEFFTETVNAYNTLKKNGSN